MPAKLDLTWEPKAGESTPPAGKAPAIYRNDTYAHTIRVTDGVTNNFDDWTWIAQIRTSRLKAGVTPGSATSFVVTLEDDTPDLLVHIGLASATTTALSLPNGGFWDLQLTLAGTVATWLAGKVKVLDDVSRT